MNMYKDSDRTARRSGVIGSASSVAAMSSQSVPAIDAGFQTGENTKANFVQVRRDKNKHRWTLSNKNSEFLTRIEVGILKNVSYANTGERVPHGCSPGEYEGSASGLLLSQNDEEYKQVMGRIFDGRRVRFDGGTGKFWDNINRGGVDSVKYLILLKDGSAVHILQ